MHVWTHRRFHDATDPRFMRYWLAVRTKIIDLIVAPAGTVTLDEKEAEAYFRHSISSS